MELSQFRSHPNCTGCDLHSQAAYADGGRIPRTVGMASVWWEDSLPPSPTTPALFVLGQNPGRNEDQQGRPFVGDSGDLLKRVYLPGPSLHTKASIYLGNAVRCHTVNNDTPKPKHIRACAPYLVDDLVEVLRIHSDASVGVLLLGVPAVQSFYKHVLGSRKSASLTSAFQSNGRGFSPDSLGGRSVAVFAAYHPAYIRRKNSYITTVHDHMGLVGSWLDETLPVPSQPDLIEPCLPSEYPS